jgi:hypothetical protein
MNFRKLPTKITLAATDLSSFFVRSAINAASPLNESYSTWRQYGGGPDHRLLADGNIAIIDIFMN